MLSSVPRRRSLSSASPSALTPRELPSPSPASLSPNCSPSIPLSPSPCPSPSVDEKHEYQAVTQTNSNANASQFSHNSNATWGYNDKDDDKTPSVASKSSPCIPSPSSKSSKSPSSPSTDSLSSSSSSISSRLLWLQKVAVILRLPYHINFFIIIMGFVLASQLTSPLKQESAAVKTSPVTAWELIRTFVPLYLSFCCLLYTGVYCFNGYMDYAYDMHVAAASSSSHHQQVVPRIAAPSVVKPSKQPQRPWRQLFTPTQYLVLAAVLFPVGVLSIHFLPFLPNTRRDEAEFGMQMIYLAFVGWNMLYSIGKQAFHGWIVAEAVMSAFTAPLRLFFGVYVAWWDGERCLAFMLRSDNVMKFVAIYAYMSSIHLLRKRNAKTEEARQQKRERLFRVKLALINFSIVVIGFTLEWMKRKEYNNTTVIVQDYSEESWAKAVVYWSVALCAIPFTILFRDLNSFWL